MPEDSDADDLGARLRAAARAARPSAAVQELIAEIPELGALQATPQDPIWHPEGDVLTHSLWAADAAARLAGDHGAELERRELLVLSALLHDVGKPATTRLIDMRIRSAGHAASGGRIARALGARLGWPPGLTRGIAVIVETHMDHVSVTGEPTARAVRRLIGRLERGGVTLDDWAIVVRADGEARGSAARPDASSSWRRVAASLPPEEPPQDSAL